MKAYVVEAFGPPEAIAFQDITAAELPNGNVRIRVRAAGASLLDALIAAGKYQVKPPLPFSPGSEFAGEVEAAAADVTTVKLGQRVMAGGFTGGFSQTAVVPAIAAVPIPDAMSFETAAGFRTNYMTALHAFRQRAALKAGETLLVLGAGGGVGSAGIEIAKIMGARVIAAASSDARSRRSSAPIMRSIRRLRSSAIGSRRSRADAASTSSTIRSAGSSQNWRFGRWRGADDTWSWASRLGRFLPCRSISRC